MITNGALCARDVFKDIDEVLVSYHLSKSCKFYDKQMFPLGCTWSKASKTAALAREHGKIVRTNTVLGTFNIDDLLDIAADLA